MGKSKKSTVPRKASRGMGASHRRHGTGGGMRSKAGVLWRPPENLQGLRGALAELGQRPKGCECDGVGTRRVETPRGKRVKRAATHRVNIASHGSKGSFILNDGIRSYGWLDELLDRLGCKVTIVIDSCYSGSALPHLGQPGREVYVACGVDEVSTGEYDRRFAEALGGVEADVDGDGVVEMWEADRWGRKLTMTIRFSMVVRADSDGDGLGDNWENKYFNDLNQGADDDPDKDGLSNKDEYDYQRPVGISDWGGKLNPNSSDTDNDGLLDGWKDVGYFNISGNRIYGTIGNWDYQDINNNSRWDIGEPCERFGELGDIRSPITTGIYKGSISHLLLMSIQKTGGAGAVLDEKYIPDPLIMDIYVEIDHMEGHEPDFLGSITHYTSGIALDFFMYFLNQFMGLMISALIFAISIVLIPAAIIAVITAMINVIILGIISSVWSEDCEITEIFQDHNIRLHIDDGSMGEGGEEVEESEGIYLNKEEVGPNNDILDNKWGNGGYRNSTTRHYEYGPDNHFIEERLFIFHYSLFIKNALDDGGDEILGIASVNDDDFLVSYGNSKEKWREYIPFGYNIAPYINPRTMHATIFMHELGHNLGLRYAGGISFTDSEEGYLPYFHHSCMNYYYIFSITDYTTEEWDDINPSLFS